MTTSETAVIGLAPQWRPTVPISDDREEASAVLNRVLARSLTFTDELRAIANLHLDEAPASSEHVLDLTSAISRTVREWIEGWPS